MIAERMTTAQYRLLGQLRRPLWRVYKKWGDWVLCNRDLKEIEVLDDRVVQWMFEQSFLEARDSFTSDDGDFVNRPLYTLSEQGYYVWDAENVRNR